MDVLQAVDKSDKNMMKNQINRIELMEETRERILEQARKAFERQKLHYDRKNKQRSYIQVGNKVAKELHMLPNSIESKKLIPKYSSSATIVKILPDNKVLVRYDSAGRVEKVHQAGLKNIGRAEKVIRMEDLIEREERVTA
ncbi:hypothetical protein SNEBB_000209 [Seison nebaliae]|nr:hypothetical protein SNEBB_000209 [Seison nebaliae]